MLRALEETENALVNYREEQQRLVKLTEQARESTPRRDDRARALSGGRRRLSRAARRGAHAAAGGGRRRAGRGGRVHERHRGLQGPRRHPGFLISSKRSRHSRWPNPGGSHDTLESHVFAAALVLTGVDQAQAQTQESAAGPGAVEVTIIPGGGTFFTEGKDTQGPSFGNYDLGGSATRELQSLRRRRRRGQRGARRLAEPGLHRARQTSRRRTSSTTAATWSCRRPTSSVVPYATGGLGGLSLFERAALGDQRHRQRFSRATSVAA